MKKFPKIKDTDKISVHKAKDLVLHCLSTNQPGLKYSGIAFYKKQEALKELEKDGYITLIEISAKGTGNVRTYEFETLTPKGKAFHKDGKSFRAEAIKEWWIDFPKNYWYLFIISGIIGYSVRDIITNLLRYIQK